MKCNKIDKKFITTKGISCDPMQFAMHSATTMGRVCMHYNDGVKNPKKENNTTTILLS